MPMQVLWKSFEDEIDGSRPQGRWKQTVKSQN